MSGRGPRAVEKEPMGPYRLERTVVIWRSGSAFGLDQINLLILVSTGMGDRVRVSFLVWDIYLVCNAFTCIIKI